MKKIVLLIIFMFTVSLFAQEDLSSQLFLDSNVLLAQATPDVKTESDVSLPGTVDPGFKSRGRAFFLSLVLPGLGERYVGNKGKAQFFFATEISLWLSYTGFVTYREWQKDDYKTYAATHAGVDLDGKSESYFVDIGNYNNIYQYNETKLRDRNLPEYYYDVDEYYWSWDSPTDQHNFKQMRLSADRADNRATFVIGAIFANHLISAIDAVWDVHKHNKSLQQSAINWDIHMGPMNDSPSLGLKVAARF